MKLSELKPNPGATKKRKRVGRGRGSGHGKTSCRGHKGQNSRSGGKTPPWFEGGQMPLYRRLPKRGFTNIFKTEYAILNVDCLNRFPEGTEVTPEQLVKSGIVKKMDCIKVLGNGELKCGLTVHAHKFTKAAREKIEKSGGKAVEI